MVRNPRPNKESASSVKTDAPADRPGGSWPALRFILIFVTISSTGIYLEYHFMINDLARGYRTLVTSASNWLPTLLGIEAQLKDTTIIASSRILEVTPECSGIKAIGIFCAGALAFPCGARKTLLGLLIGFIGVGVLNILRVSALTIVLARSPESFDPVHDALTHLFPLGAVLPLWLAWLLFVVRGPKRGVQNNGAPAAAKTAGAADESKDKTKG